jgi:hypothetical protein
MLLDVIRAAIVALVRRQLLAGNANFLSWDREFIQKLGAS